MYVQDEIVSELGKVGIDECYLYISVYIYINSILYTPVSNIYITCNSVQVTCLSRAESSLANSFCKLSCTYLLVVNF